MINFQGCLFAPEGAVPAVLIVQVVKMNDVWQTSNDISAFWKGISGLIAEYVIVVIILAYVWRFASQFVMAVIEKYSKAEYSLDRDDFIFIETALSNVVDSKTARFLDYVKQQGSKQKLDAATTFLTITKPRDQIRLLTNAIYSVLSYFDKKYRKGQADFRVGLLEIVEGKPVEWLEYKGASGPALTPAELAEVDSTVMACIKARRPIFIHNIVKESKKAQNKRRYTELSEDTGADMGSLVCYPVKYGYKNDIPYVITVKTDLKNHLKPDGLYEWIIERFVNRMLLEHSLFILREKSL